MKEEEAREEAAFESWQRQRETADTITIHLPQAAAFSEQKLGGPHGVDFQEELTIPRVGRAIKHRLAGLAWTGCPAE